MGEKTGWEHDWCSLNILELNTLRTVEMVVDFRRTPPPHHHHSPSYSWEPPSLRTWSGTLTSTQQRLHFLRQLRMFNLPQELLKQFYSAIIESVLCTLITVWFSYQIWSQKTMLDCWANHWYNPPVPTLRDCTYPEWAKGLAKSLCLDPSHPAHSLFELLPSG